MASGDEEALLPFGDVEDKGGQDSHIVGHGLHSKNGDDPLPFGDMGDEEVRDLRHLDHHNPSIQPLQELPFAQWYTDLAPVTHTFKRKPETKDFSYVEEIYTPAANTTHNFVRAYLMITHRRENLHLKDDVRFITRLPFDILIEIVKHLHPLDVYNITLAGPSLEVHIKPPVWKAVWDCHPEIPPKPATLSYLQWAKLWFGPSVCERCHKRVAQPDFTRSKRYCSKCLYSKVQFLYQSSSNETQNLLSCCPAASRTNGYHIQGFRNTGNGCRFTEDVQKARRRLREFDNEISKGVPGSSKAKDEYIRSMSAAAKALFVHTARCQQYAAKIFYFYKGVKHAHVVKLVEKVKKKLVSTERFTMDELSNLYHHLDHRWQQDHLLTINSKVIKHTWNTLIGPISETCRQLHREANRAQSIRRRERVIEVAYETFQKEKVKPETWHKLPPPSAVLKMRPCHVYAHNVETQEAEVEEGVRLVKEVEGQILAWFEEAKKRIFEHFVQEKCKLDERNGQAIEEPRMDMDQPEPTFGAMDLAVCVFSCHYCDPGQYGYGEGPSSWVGAQIFGWEGVSKHLYCREPRDAEHDSFALNATCWKAVHAILERLHLDHRTTTGKDMDELGYRFLCQACFQRPPGYKRWIGQLSFDWRGLVKHLTDGQYHYAYGEVPVHNQWDVLSPEAVRYLSPREGRHPERADPSWSCNHCAVHFDSLVTYHTVLSHLKDLHNINEAKIEVDVVHIPHTYLTFVAPVVIPVAPHNLRCLICPEDKSFVRWFNRKGILRHLHDKHGIGIDEAKESRPWKVVDMFLSIH